MREVWFETNEENPARYTVYSVPTSASADLTEAEAREYDPAPSFRGATA